MDIKDYPTASVRGTNIEKELVEEFDSDEEQDREGGMDFDDDAAEEISDDGRHDEAAVLPKNKKRK